MLMYPAVMPLICGCVVVSRPPKPGTPEAAKKMSPQVSSTAVQGQIKQGNYKVPSSVQHAGKMTEAEAKVIKMRNFQPSLSTSVLEPCKL